jgi:hypothetical protein
MAAAFDPYHKWLGIPPAEQPPNHYRLLAINPFESDPDVIEGAADRLMAHLRSLQTGQQAELTQKMLNKISAAKLCLLRPEKKKEYDDALRAKLAKAGPAATTSSAPAESPAMPVAAPIVASPLDFINAPAPKAKSGTWEPEPLPVSSRGTSFKSTTSGYSSRKKSNSNMPAIYAIVGVVAMLAIGGIILATNQGGGEPERPDNNVATNVDRHPSVDPLASKTLKTPTPHPLPTKTPSVPSHPNDSNSDKSPPPNVPSTGDTSKPPVDTNPTPDKPVQPKPPDNPPPTPETQPAAPVDNRKPVPDAAAQAKSVAQVHEVLKDDFAKAISPEARAELIRKLIKLATETNDDPSLRYVMGTQAMDMAVKAGESDLAFEAIDGMNAYFLVDGWDLKAKSLIQLSHQAKTPPLKKQIAAQALAMTETALKEDHYDPAVELSSLASTMADSAGEPLLKDQAHEARARAQRLQNLGQAFKAANEKLAAHPDDAEANLVVGKFLCFQKDDWKTGLPHLARGSDETLKALAIQEAAAPAAAPEQVKLADAWWEAAEKIGDKNNPQIKPMFARAKYWYHDAIPGLTGLALEKAQKRSTEETAVGDIGAGKMVYLDDLPEQDVTVGYGTLGKHGATGFTADQPQEVVFRGAPIKHALSMSPPSSDSSKVSFIIDHKFHTFTAIVGIQDKAQPRSAVTFELRGDGKLLWASRPIRRPEEGQECSVQVQNFKTLQLEVRCSGGNEGSWAAWFNPLLKK